LWAKYAQRDKTDTWALPLHVRRSILYAYVVLNVCCDLVYICGISKDMEKLLSNPKYVSHILVKCYL
jgi:hypothetical protein